MPPRLILRVHADRRLGLGHAMRALALASAWQAKGGACALAVSGDERARRMGQRRHPFLDESLPFEAEDLGEDLHSPLGKLKGDVVLVDQWDTTAAQIEALRPMKVAVMEDDGEAHEAADLLFQPYLEGVAFEDHPLRMVNAHKLRPFEDRRGSCRVLRGSAFAVVDGAASALRPRRQPLQPLAIHKLLVTFGGSDGPGLAQRAFDILRGLVAEDRWRGTCLILAPGGIQGDPFPGCTIQASLPNLTRRLQDFDALWCAMGITLAEALCLGQPVAAWGQNARQHGILGDLALAGGCFDLGVGPEADPAAAADALAQWLGPEGLDNRQEQVQDGMKLIDGLGAQRVVQELWALARG